MVSFQHRAMEERRKAVKSRQRKSKNQDNILMVADVMTMACSSWHEKYREKADLAVRYK